MLSLARKLELADVVVTTGIGKSGDVARLGASLLQSVGVKAQFIHAVDMFHGGLGVFTHHPDNCIAYLIAFSHSGQTPEISRLLELLPQQVETVLITGGRPSGPPVNHIYRYEIDKDGSDHGTIPVYSSIEQVRIVGELASTIANDRTAEQLLANHPSGRLSLAYLKEMIND